MSAEEHPVVRRMRALARAHRAAGRPATLHCVHRGGARVAPENTFAAFEWALRRWRTDLFELDVQRSADGELVVWHDDDLDRCSEGRGPVAAQPWAQLARLDASARFAPDADAPPPNLARTGQRPLRLVRLLRAFPHVLLNIELKPAAARAAEPFVALLRAEGALARACIGSEDDALAERLRQLAPDACHFYPAQALAQAVRAGLSGLPLPEAPYQVLAMPARWQGIDLMQPALLRAAAEAGRWVHAWTLNEADEMRALCALGVGGIMTDRPDRLRRVLDHG